MFYEKQHADRASAEYIKELFPAILDLPCDRQTMAVDALYTSWKSSGYEKIEDMPFSDGSACTLYEHINEVIKLGMLLFESTRKDYDDEWTERIDETTLLECLILHDIDKPIVFNKNCEAYDNILHGTLGGIMLKDLGYEDRIISIVSCHSPKCSVHPLDPIFQILHYADLYSADRIMMLDGNTRPFYRR